METIRVAVSKGVGGSYGDLAVELPATHAGYQALVRDALARLVYSPGAVQMLEADQAGSAKLLEAIVEIVKSGAKFEAHDHMGLLRAAVLRVRPLTVASR